MGSGNYSDDRARLDHTVLGRQWEILAKFTGFSEGDKAFRGATPAHTSCPVCGGTNTFRVVKRDGEITGYFCGRGQGGGGGNFKGLIAHLTHKSYAVICSELRDYLFDEKPPTQADKDLWARKKKERLERDRQHQIRLNNKQVSISNSSYKKYASLPEHGESEYLAVKQVKAYQGVRFQGSTLIIPTYDHNKNIWGVQSITENGDKRFIKGQKRKGMFFVIGKLQKGKPVLFVEGYSTGATVHDVTGLPVVVCFVSGNVDTVIMKWQKMTKGRYLLINIADNDHAKHRKSIEAGGVIIKNAGYEVAKKVSLLGVRSIAPIHYGEDGISDFNDVYVLFDKEECETQLKRINKLI